MLFFREKILKTDCKYVFYRIRNQLCIINLKLKIIYYSAVNDVLIEVSLKVTVKYI